MIAVCRQCGAFIPDENIDYGRLLAICPGCAAELPIQWDKRKGLLEKRRPHPVDKPARFDVRHQGSGLEIRVPWIRIKYFFMAPGALLLTGFTLYWIIPSLDRSAWGTVAVLMVPCAWGLFLLYLVLAGLLNSTHLRIGHGELAVAHGPVPFPGVRLKTWDVQQVYCIKRVRRSRSGTVFASYILYAATRDGSRRRLLGDLAGPGEAWYLEQEIENALDLDDRLVTENGYQPRP